VAIKKGISMLRYHDVAHNKTSMRALTTLEPDEFTALVLAFEHCFSERMRDYTIDGLPRMYRCYTPYKNSPLPTIEDKLLFILVHIKQNPTQEIQGHLFGMKQSVANKWLQLLRPILHQALQHLEVCPARVATIPCGNDAADVHEDAKNVNGNAAITDTSPLFIMMALNVPSSDR
jgi:Helix-turn-helix of DDE superfamily endonuclease